MLHQRITKVEHNFWYSSWHVEVDWWYRSVSTTKNGPSPFLLLDGHGSQLEVRFQSYINDPSHKWVVCIEVPNVTSLCQVGDSNEQNGCYKMYFTQCKNMITKRRFDVGLFKLNIVRTDIVPIVNYVRADWFNNIDTKKKAIRDRGWGPLNKKLL